MTYDEIHRHAREKGVSRRLYAVIRLLLIPVLHLYFRLRITGAHNIPEEGPAVITPNHKSFWDSFFTAAATPRHMRFMAKSELFDGPTGGLLLRLGAFPVRRGEADEAALETAREILRQGGLLELFPEGTRIRDPEELGSPRRGAARLALETGAPVIPAAITGTDHLFLGPIPKPKRVQVAFGEPVRVTGPQATPEAAAELTDEVWPRVEGEFRALRSRKGLIAAGAAGVAAMGVGALTIALRRGKR